MKKAHLCSILFMLYIQAYAQTINTCDTITQWEQIFVDDFNEQSLNTQRWFTYYPYTSDGSDRNCKFCRTHDEHHSNQIFMDDNFKTENGILHILTEREAVDWQGVSKPFSSGVIESKNLYNVYSKFEIRCKINKSNGLWPAFWMFGKYGTEIDVFEIFTEKPKLVYITLHNWFSSNNKTVDAFSQIKYKGLDYSVDFHVFSVEVHPYVMIWKIDDVEVRRLHRLIPKDGNQRCLYEQNTYTQELTWPKPGDELKVIANTAVKKVKGPRKKDKFPSSFEIDYIKIYKPKLD